MPASFSGGCACGAIRYECSAAPLMMLNCHCRDCQRENRRRVCPVCGGGCQHRDYNERRAPILSDQGCQPAPCATRVLFAVRIAPVWPSHVGIRIYEHHRRKFGRPELV